MIPLTSIMIGLLIAVGAIVLGLLILALINPIFVKIGLRNIPRRPARSSLIVVGLTLSTIIILSALSTGDTLSYSLRSHAVKAYGKIDEIIAPPIITLLATLGDEDGFSEEAADNEQVDELTRLTEGGLTTVLAVLEGGLPGITEERYEALRLEAEEEPLIDAVASSIIFPTIIRDVSTGQGEPFGFIFAVDNDYDEQFGLTSIDGEPVEMESLETGVGNIFAQAANLFGLVESAGQNLGMGDIQISDVAIATAAIGAALTTGGAEGGIDLANITIDLETLQSLGVDTSILEEAGIESLSLETLGLDTDQLQAMGVTTTTVGLETLGIDTTAAQDFTTNLLGALNLNTLGSEIDRVLSQAGLQLRQGDVYLNRLGAEQLNARVGDVLEIYIGPIPIPFRVKAIVDQAGPMGALAPVVMLRLDEAQKLLFMDGRVNNVLISNLGNEIEGIDQTEAVSERIRTLALDPERVAQLVAILQRPDVRPIVEREAANVEEEFLEDFEGPAFMASFIEGLAGVEDYQEKVRAFPAALDEDAPYDELRTLLADNGVREWLLSLPISGQDDADLVDTMSQLNQFDLVTPLSKSTIVTVAAFGGTIFTSVFSVFGILSIIAGILLIFLIFVMMAAERRSEMGMARAIGVQRTHLVQMFVTEGVVYDLVAAALGVLLGLAVSYAMVGFLGRLFNDISQQVSGQSTLFQIQFHVAPTSLVIAYCIGVLFTFVVVTIAAWRVSRLNIVSAIRGLPEPDAVGGASTIGRIVNLALGPIVAILGGVVIYYGASESLSLLLAGLSLILAGASLFLGWWLNRTALRTENVQRIVYTTIGGGLLLLWAVPWDRLLNQVGTEVDLGGPWILISFVLTGPMIILGAILVVMFNADAWAWGLSRLLGGIGALTPVLRTAVAYPLSSRFRTGMAMLLFAMIISTVTIMTVVIEATQSIVAPDSERNAGFDISVSGSLLTFFDPLEDMEAEIPDKPDFPVDEVAIVGSVATNGVDVQQLDIGQQPDADWHFATLIGVNNGYLEQAETVYSFSQRAPGYATDAAIWQRCERDDVAVITTNFVPDNMETDDEAAVDVQVTTDSGDAAQEPDTRRAPPDDEFPWARRLRLTGFTEQDATLPEIQLALRPPDGGESGDAPAETVQIIGVIAESTTLAGEGILIPARVYATLSEETVVPNNFYVKIADGAEVHEVAHAVERAFLNNAVNATVMAESFAQGQAVTRGILQLFQGFLALGLLVGIAALGVISTRTVVERRQQVGMLRAIGFQPRMVALSFLMESSFIALTGILVGTAAGVALGQSMVSLFFEELTGGRTFATPWLQIGIIVLAAYLFALLTTILPAYQASRIYPAEALRYE